jgi:hypothetical protein
LFENREIRIFFSQLTVNYKSFNFLKIIINTNENVKMIDILLALKYIRWPDGRIQMYFDQGRFQGRVLEVEPSLFWKKLFILLGFFAKKIPKHSLKVAVNIKKFQKFLDTHLSLTYLIFRTERRNSGPQAMWRGSLLNQFINFYKIFKNLLKTLEQLELFESSVP